MNELNILATIVYLERNRRRQRLRRNPGDIRGDNQRDNLPWYTKKSIEKKLNIVWPKQAYKYLILIMQL